MPMWESRLAVDGVHKLSSRRIIGWASADDRVKTDQTCANAGQPRWCNSVATNEDPGIFPELTCLHLYRLVVGKSCDDNRFGQRSLKVRTRKRKWSARVSIWASIILGQRPMFSAGENTGFAVPVCGIQPNLASVSDLRNPPLNLLLRKMRRVFFDRLCWLIDFRLISAENPDSVTT